MGKRRHKFNACKCQEDGFTFPSKLERDTYRHLKLLHDKGIVVSVVLQYPFVLRANSGAPIGKYVADFVCTLPNGREVVVESKGKSTSLWNRSKKHFIADYPEYKLIEVRDRSELPWEL